MSRASQRALIPAGVALCLTLAACGGAAAPQVAPAPAAAPPDSITFAPSLGVDLSTFTRTKLGAWYKDVVRGTGAAAAIDRTLTMKYVVSLPSGTVVETQATPVDVLLDSRVLRGWRDALPGMRVGGSRTIVLPPDLAYGRRSPANIPANSTLVFEIELVAVH